MADLVEIPIVVKDQGLKQAITTVTRLERELTRAVKAIDNGTMSQRRFNQILSSSKQQYKDYAGNAGLATININRFVKAQEEAIATSKRTSTAMAQQARANQDFYRSLQQASLAHKEASASADVFSNRIDALRQKYNPLYAASKQYETMLNEIREAHTLGAMSAGQFEIAQEELAQQFANSTGAFARYNSVTQGNTRLMNRMGVVTQQAGYQIGDFLVQVQSGTNAFVAFGQQATQLAGVMTLFGGRFILLGSVLGVVIPLMTALGATMMRTRSASQDSAKGIKSLEDRINSARQAMEGFNEEIRRYAIGARDAGEQALLEGVAETLETIKTLQAEIAENQAIGTITAPNERELANAQELLRSRQEELEAYRASRRESELLGAAEERRIENMRLNVEYAERDAALIQERNEGVQRILQAVQTETQTLRDRAMLAAAETQFGRESVEFRTLQATIEERIYREQLSQNGILGNNQERMVALRQSALRLEERLEGASKAAQDLANALQMANSFSQGLDQNVATLEARLAEAKGQQGAVLALTISQMEAEAELNAMRSRAAGEDEVIVRARLATDRAQINQIKELSTEIEKYGNRSRTAGRKAEDALTDAEKAALDYAKALDGQVISAIDGISNAWGQFVVRGFNDFKSFANAVLNSFKSMLANMIAMAAKNQIMLSLGIGGVGAAGAATSAVGSIGGMAGQSLLSGGGMLAGTGLGSALTGLSTGFMSTINAGFAGMSGAISGGLSVGGIGGISTAIGAAIPVLGAVAAAVSFFRSKTKELDSGLKITVNNMDTLVQSFSTIQKSRFWGLSKRVSTTLTDVEKEAAEPLIKAVGDVQKSVMDAAAAFGIAGSTFDNFFYEMDISLKGLTEDQKMQKINEELAKMGDEFASLTGHFETMNELLEAANQRMQLQNRLDQLLGNNAAILARQRQAELSAMHELNRPLAQAIYNLEDAQSAVQNAFAALRVSIEAEKNRLRDAFTSIVEGLRERLDVATDAARRSQSVFDMLEGALSGRFVSQGMSNTFARREGALSFLRGGNFEDEKRLEEALQVIGEPTEDLFSSFVDYARDFARTSYTIEEAKKVAQVQLTADEKQVLLLEEQIAQAQADLDAQLTALDEQLLAMERQYNALLGIDDSVKSVTEAVGTLREAIEALAAAMDAAKKVEGAAIGGGAGAGVQAANEAGKQILNQLGQSGIAERATDGAKFQQVDIRGGQQLLEVAKSLGVQTSGRTGAEIQQAISNAGNLGVNMDNATRAQQFAMGGFHTGGLRMVGERGPELEATGPARIFSHNQTAGMFRDPDLKDAVRSLKEEVAGLRSEQRQIQMDISKYTKRTYDIERKWDVDGLPATRA